MLSLLAFVQALPRGPDSIRNYLNNAVFPYYVLHQTVIIVAGVQLSRYALGLQMEITTLVMATAVVTALLYHFVVRNMGRAAVLVGGRLTTGNH